MNFFKNKISDNYTIIIGCGRLGANIANILSERGENVLVIDKDKKAFNKLSLSFGGLTILGDGKDLDILNEAKIKDADTVVIVTDNDNINIMLSQMIKELFNINNVIIRLYNSEKKCVYKDVDIHTICPSVLSVEEVDNILMKA